LHKSKPFLIYFSVTLSPTSAAALNLVSEDRGLSLRFPRFVKVRDDKSIEQASTPEFLAQMFNKQTKGKAGINDKEVTDIDMEDQED
jgi:DNA ligase-1